MGKVVAIIAARLSSSRLPGKIFADIAGHPLLWHVITRVQQARMVDLVVIAVPHGTPILVDCGLWYFGPEDDVLARYYGAAQAAGAEVVVRITGDCPLIDPKVIDMAVWLQRDFGNEYLSNINPPTFPDGLDVEVFSIAALEKAYRNAVLQSDREHVGPWMRANLQTFNLRHGVDLSDHRWCVDEQADLDFVRAVYAEMGRDDFGMHEVLELLDRKPELTQINGHLKRNASYLAQVEGERQS